MKSNILIVLGSIFAISMIGRSFALNTAAVADGSQDQAEVVAEAKPAAGDTPENCAAGPVLESLKAQRLSLEKREKAVAEKERTLEAVEKRINERLAALDDSNRKLEQKMELLKTMAEDDITHLTSMYEQMKPQQASVIFDKMDSVFAAAFLRLMNSEQAGLILQNMRPEKAYEISIVIANKNADLRPKVE